jgi:DNA-binding transcriptional LysR family regulator
VSSDSPATLKVIAGHTVDLAPLLHGIDQLRRGGQHIRLELSRGSDVERRIANGDADAGLVRGSIRQAGLWWSPVSAEPVIAVVTDDHPLAGMAQPDMSDLLHEDVVELSEGSLGIGRATGTPETLLAHVVADRSVGLLPMHLLPGDDSGLSMRTVLGLVPALTFVLRRHVDVGAVLLLTHVMAGDADNGRVDRGLRGADAAALAATPPAPHTTAAIPGGQHDSREAGRPPRRS